MAGGTADDADSDAGRPSTTAASRRLASDPDGRSTTSGGTAAPSTRASAARATSSTRDDEPLDAPGSPDDDPAGRVSAAVAALRRPEDAGQPTAEPAHSLGLAIWIPGWPGSPASPTEPARCIEHVHIEGRCWHTVGAWLPVDLSGDARMLCPSPCPMTLMGSVHVRAPWHGGRRRRSTVRRRTCSAEPSQDLARLA